MTCKHFYALCVPSIQCHNALCSRFHHLTYYENPGDPFPTIVTAADLIERIAVEPVVAPYIHYASFKLDSLRSHVIIREYVGDSDRRDDVITLFANCLYPEQAGPDWKEHLDKIEAELNVDKLPRYPQHAATFLFTLLPHIKKLTLPQH